MSIWTHSDLTTQLNARQNKVPAAGPAGFDYRVASLDSACYNAGTSQGRVALDVYKTPRKIVPDIGACEYAQVYDVGGILSQCTEKTPFSVPNGFLFLCQSKR